MIVILKPHAAPEKVQELKQLLQSQGLEIHSSTGREASLLGLIGDTSKVDIEALGSLDIVESVKRVTEPYKLANRKYHTDDTVITLEGGQKIGGDHFSVFAGPCSVESYDQIVYTAQRVKAAGAQFLRGGAFKPRTSPYAFRGMRAEGIHLLLEAKAATGLPIVTEIMSPNHLEMFADVDIIQVGARNMQNFELLTQLGRCNKPILLKRGLSSTLEELLMSAEYIMAEGNEKVILCERGIRTFETATRNTLDISAVPLLKKMSHLPVIVDPSHASGISSLIPPLAKTAVVAGGDGLMIEVHPDPEHALCDGAQSITPDRFDTVMESVKKLCILEGKAL